MLSLRNQHSVSSKVRCDWPSTAGLRVAASLPNPTHSIRLVDHCKAYTADRYHFGDEEWDEILSYAKLDPQLLRWQVQQKLDDLRSEADLLAAQRDLFEEQVKTAYLQLDMVMDQKRQAEMLLLGANAEVLYAKNMLNMQGLLGRCCSVGLLA